MVRWIKAGIPLPLGSVANQRSLIHIDNLTEILKLCLEHPEAAGQIFHVRDRHDYSTPEILAGVARAMNCPLRLLHFPLPVLQMLARAAGQGDAFRQLTGWLQVDDSKVRERLDFIPAELSFDGG
jgi:nucleoside-diphosphate-sugar epimerase